MADEKLLKNKKGVMAFNRTMVKTQSHDGKWYAKVGMRGGIISSNSFSSKENDLL